MNTVIKKLINENLKLYLQPLYNPNTKSYEIYEVLSRIELNNTLYSPPIFLAKQNKKYSHYLTICVVKKLKSYIHLFPKNIKFSINVEAWELSDQSLLDSFKSIQDNLIIEILEHTKDLEKYLEYIKKYKEHNILIALDDFGAGSTFSTFLTDYCNDFNVFDIIKLDKNIIINASQKNEQILKYIVMMIKHNNQKIVAEYICDEKIYQKILKYDIDYLQGYFLSKPIDIELFVNQNYKVEFAYQKVVDEVVSFNKPCYFPTNPTTKSS